MNRNKSLRSIFIIILFLVLLFMAAAGSCIAQQDTTRQKPMRLILVDGSELMGTIMQEDSTSAVFKTISDIVIAIPRNKIRTMEYLSGQIAEGRYVVADPNDTRLFFAPTARPLKAGCGYFSAYQIFFPMAAVGIADVVNLAGGFSLLPGSPNQLFYFAPKITVLYRENLSLAGGVLYLNSTGGGKSSAGFFYGVGTYGTKNTALTLGLGWGYTGSDVSNKPVLLIGGEMRASDGIKFISENWFLPHSEINLLSFGIRFFGESLAADLGLIYPAGSEITGFPFFPWLGFAYNFGTAR